MDKECQKAHNMKINDFYPCPVNTAGLDFARKLGANKFGRALLST